MQMNELVLNVIFFLTVGILFTLAPMYLYRLYSLYKKLKECETEEWNRLGSPTLIMNNSLRNSYLVVKWLLSKEYLNLDDQKIVNEARLCRILLIAGTIATITSFILYGIIISLSWSG